MNTVRDAAAQYLDPLPSGLKNRVVRLAVFESDEDCRFFYPRRALPFQQQMNTAISREVRKRGGKVERLTFTPAEYRQEDGDDTEAARRAWIDNRIGLMP